MEIGEKLKQKRTASGLSQEQLAEKLGVTRQTIANWERNKTYPDIGSILKLSDLYGVSLDELLKEDENMRKHMESTATFPERLVGLLLDLAILLLPLSVILYSLGMEELSGGFKIACFVAVPVLYLILTKIKGENWKDSIIAGILWAIYAFSELLELGLGNSINGLAPGVANLWGYLLLGLILIYNRHKGLWYWVKLVFFFGALLTSNLVANFPELMTAEEFNENAPFGYVYTVEEVYFETEGAQAPGRIEINELGYLELDGEGAGFFSKEQTSLGKWEMSGRYDKEKEYILEEKFGGTMELMCRSVTVDGTRTLWDVELRHVPLIKFKITFIRNDGMTGCSGWMNWYSANQIRQGMVEFQPITMDVPGVGMLMLEDESIDELTVVEEYHCDGEIETRTIQLKKGRDGNFAFPEKFQRRYPEGEQFVLYTIAWEEGEYLVQLNYPAE